ncbi:MAG: hypothetical protein JWN04_3325 [Myxococcaceae bacterium]|nr:hypothetical protein [Myxococcaceae bacterium]
MANPPLSEITLPHGHTGSSLFHAVLAEAAAEYPSELAAAELPSTASAFKPKYGHALARFEAARVGSPRRVEMARFILRRTQEALCFGHGDESLPLLPYMQERVATPALEHMQLAERGGLTLEVPLDGRVYRGDSIHGVVDRLYLDHQISSAARAALHWIVDYSVAQGGKLDLHGERFVLLGAGAELASTELLLSAGASVLWVDVTDPAQSLLGRPQLAGSLSRAPAASNLLSQPREIAAAIRAFADRGPVHVGMFAYAPGASKEWRLGAAMNAIVGSLEPELVRSVSLLISPTTPSVLSRDTQRRIDSRYELSPAWQKWLERLGVIDYPGTLRLGDARVSLSTVSLQGLSYQAAQYISKIAAAETYAVYGIDTASETKAPITVSANVAGVTRTRSLSHPLFCAAFEGAAKFGVRVFEPATTRALNGALMLHDLLNPTAAGAASSQPREARDKASSLLAQQIHGGTYTVPYVLEGVIRAAAVAGLAKHPSLLLPKRKRVEPTTQATGLLSEYGRLAD